MLRAWEMVVEGSEGCICLVQKISTKNYHHFGINLSVHVGYKKVQV